MANRFNMKGNLKANLRPKDTRAPNFRGVLTIDDAVFWVSAWNRTNPSTGAAFLSLKLNINTGDGSPHAPIPGGVVKSPVSGQGSITLMPNGSISGNLEIDTGRRFYVEGSYSKSAIKLSLKETLDKASITFEVTKDELSVLEDYAHDHESTLEGLMAHMVRNFIAQLRSPKT